VVVLGEVLRVTTAAGAFVLEIASISMVKEVKKRKRSMMSAWKDCQGWQKVDVGDELLLGSEEGGFLELEEYKPSPGSVMFNQLTVPESQVEPGKPKKAKKAEKSRQGADEKDHQKKSKAQVPSSDKAAAAKPEPSRSKKKAKPAHQRQEAGTSQAADTGSDDVAALKAQLASLHEENRRLKQERPGRQAPDPNSSRSANRAKAKEIRKAKKAKARARRLRSAANEGVLLNASPAA
jgi:hypothetical protein